MASWIHREIYTLAGTYYEIQCIDFKKKRFGIRDIRKREYIATDLNKDEAMRQAEALARLEQPSLRIEEYVTYTRPENSILTQLEKKRKR